MDFLLPNNSKKKEKLEEMKLCMKSYDYLKANYMYVCIDVCATFPYGYVVNLDTHNYAQPCMAIKLNKEQKHINRNQISLLIYKNNIKDFVIVCP